MANQISYTGSASDVFRPQSGFQISVHGTTTKNYTVKTLPEEVADTSTWLDAALASTNIPNTPVSYTHLTLPTKA